MKIQQLLFKSSLVIVLFISFQYSIFAQRDEVGVMPGKTAFDPVVEYPAKNFATAEEHYNYLLEEAEGGTQHSMGTIPVWDGLWSPGYNSMPSLFLEGGSMAVAMSPGGVVKEGVLTPAYEEQFRQRRAEIETYGRQLYDRLTTCQYPGTARWLWEPYVKEFANTPAQTWMLNDLMNETRRVYINAEHINIEGNHSATGDSIGFWDNNKLIIWTKWINPADYLRGMPLTSNQLEMVETWQEQLTEEGFRQLVTQATFYDPIGLQTPQSAVYTHTSSPELVEFGARIRNWECTTSSNSYQDENGRTFFYLPGNPEYKDPRGFTDFPDIPGQSLNPMNQ